MKNIYEIINDKVYITLTQGQFGIIDLEDYKKICEDYSSSWCARRDRLGYFYVLGKLKINRQWKSILLHRYLLDLTDPKIYVDHKNHNPLDNTRENIRICTNSENQHNKRSFKNSCSKYKGVSFDKRYAKYVVHIQYQGKNHYLGSFINEMEAALTYNKKAEEFFGEFAYLNIVE